MHHCIAHTQKHHDLDDVKQSHIPDNKAETLTFHSGEVCIKQAFTYLKLRVNLSDHTKVESIQDFGSVHGDHSCFAQILQKNLWFRLTRHLDPKRDKRTI